MVYLPGVLLIPLLEPIAILQKKIMRGITFNENTAPSTPMFDSLQILKFNVIILLQITFFVYECVNNLAPAYFRNFFRSIHNVHDIGTRQSKRGDLFALRCNTTQYGLRSVYYSGVRLWNSLLKEIRSSNSLSNFKKTAKSYLLSLLIITDGSSPFPLPSSMLCFMLIWIYYFCAKECIVSDLYSYHIVK